jgi:geranylgeranyl diphosphate synthase type II
LKGLEYTRLKSFVDKHLLDFLPEVDNNSITILDSMKYSLEAGGKRLRPILLLESHNFCGQNMYNALPYACAVEYIHTYSLIHDDLPALDNDDLRRGKPTNHKIFGEAVAIIAGDGLLNSAFELMNKDMLLYFDDVVKLKRRVKAAYEISKGAGCKGMIAGQIADIEAIDKNCSKELLDYIHVNKTGALIVASVRAGAHLGGADDKTLKSLTHYAENVGLAFQIVDDILDIYGKEEEMGKACGSDIKQNKLTYPALYGIDASLSKLTELHDEAIKAIQPYGEKASFLIDLANELSIRLK